MSDPVKTVDIEDVLSSIRRLVSNGPVVSGQKDGGKSDKLVLTPSLRVDEERAPAASAADEIAPEEEPGEDQAVQPDPDPEHSEQHDRAEPEESSVLEHGPSEARESVERDADKWEFETASEMDPAEPENEQAKTDERDRSAADDAEIERFLGEVTTALGAQAAEFEAEVAQRDDQWEPDGASDDAYAGGPVVSVEWQDATDDDESDDGYSPSADPDMEPADEAASYAFARSWESEDDAGQRAAPGTTFDFDDAVIDEDTLRDMVAEIVRQELQGTLGERITRNVRKLVRREIHRALTSQDFE
ncbi:hypothetical protein ACSSV4_000951 [Roseovarius sp. MBR-154]|jgi:hypothetical protein